MGPFRFLYHKFIVFVFFLRVSVSSLFLALFGFFNKSTLSAIANDSVQANEFNSLDLDLEPVEKEAMAKERVADEIETKKIEEIEDVIALNDRKESDGFEVDEEPKFVFKFQYQSYREEEEESINFNSVSNTTTNKYEFLSGKDFSHYVDRPAPVCHSVKEFYANSDNSLIGTEDNLAVVETTEKKLEAEKFVEGISDSAKKLDADTGSDCNVIGNDGIVKDNENLFCDVVGENNFVDANCKEKAIENFKAEKSVEESISRKGKRIDSGRVELRHDDDAEVLQIMSEDFIASDSDSDSITSSQEFVRRFIASTTDGFLSDKDFDDPFDLDSLKDIDIVKLRMSDEDLELEDNDFRDLSSGYEADDFDDEDAEIADEYSKLESGDGNNAKPEELVDTSIESEDHSDDEGADDSRKSSPLSGDSEDSNELESLWEHQDLIEQLKTELKKVRATGLPTILEEDECPKVMEDLKPWKIEEQFKHENPMSELHKFYRSYRERMRKFDILCYQKMYAIGFLQSKDPLQAISDQKVSAPALTSTFLEKLLLTKRKKKAGSDQMLNFIKELHSELETVYVGQMCLSWEFLHWQYEKALELWESDRYGLRQYNEVAGEFQQFQVLLQRFIENEAFEGPRLQNYIKKRYIFRNLLQVPVIREDSARDKKGRGRGNSNGTITSDMLVESIEETIRIFWRFVKADKKTNSPVHRARKGTQIQPQDTDELVLFAEVQACLQKKEKKLKEILRSGNCIIKKLRRHQQQKDGTDEVLCFFSQVDMKLVARVLNMSTLTEDQLLWCHNKLSKIKFSSRKIYVEPSFLLFPC